MIDLNKVEKDYNYSKIIQKENEELKLKIFKALRRIDYTNYIECNNEEKLFNYLTELKSILNGDK